ncbi:MAG TPA: DMT family transporter [Candidatus Saccharimonadales bacterium]|nr:DMT family transporter [Candidatus Saccharimonadales bacterium]
MRYNDRKGRNSFPDLNSGRYHQPEQRKRIWPYVISGIVAILLIAWFILGYWQDVLHVLWAGFVNNIWLSWLFPHGWNLFGATPLFWLLAASAGMVFVWLLAMHQRETAPRGLYATAVVAGLVIASLFGIGLWNINKSAAVHYIADDNAVFAVDDPKNMPEILQRIEEAKSPFIGITQGDMAFSWERRVGSASGAYRVMSRTGDTIARTELMQSSIGYLYGDTDSDSAWTGIRNGTKRQDIHSISVWSGTGERVTDCKFQGDSELHRAFSGSWGRNLTDDIAAFDSRFRYDEDDIYGYCDGDEPVIIIPGTKTVGAGLRTVNETYGVLTIRGSKSGNPVIEHHLNIKPGTFPMPVYAKRLTNSQIDYFKWAEGRCWMWEACFGLETTNVASQAENSSNYLLKSKRDGRLYWVTPLKPTNTDSQTIVAYSVIPADTTTAGELNKQKIYVMNNDDSRIVNLDNLENAVTDAVRTADPGFFTGDSPGRIVEFLPVSDTKWQVFAEVGGRVKYRVDVNVGTTLHSTLFRIDEEETTEQQPAASDDGAQVTCDTPASLTDQELVSCLARLANELTSRHAESK